MLKAHQQKPKIKKPKLLRSNPARYSLITQGADPNSLEFDDEALYPLHRRVRLVVDKNIDNDNDLSDYVKARLLIARVLALKRYREVYKSNEQA
jgi:hypothetical protein